MYSLNNRASSHVLLIYDGSSFHHFRGVCVGGCVCTQRKAFTFVHQRKFYANTTFFLLQELHLKRNSYKPRGTQTFFQHTHNLIFSVAMLSCCLLMLSQREEVSRTCEMGRIYCSVNIPVSPAQASSADQKQLDFHTDLIFDLLTWPLFLGFCAVAPVNLEFHRDCRSPFIGCQSDIRLQQFLATNNQVWIQIVDLRSEAHYESLEQFNLLVIMCHLVDLIHVHISQQHQQKFCVGIKTDEGPGFY